MVRIELEPLEQKDLFELLDYAREQKILNRPVVKKGSYKWDDTNYWINRIDQLKESLTHREDAGIYRSSILSLEQTEKSDYDRRGKKYDTK